MSGAMLYLLIGFAVGGVLFFIIGWLVGSRRRPVPVADNRLEEELREQVTQREAELTQLRTQAADAGKARATAEAQLASAEKLLADPQEHLQRRRRVVQLALRPRRTNLWGIRAGH